MRLASAASAEAAVAPRHPRTIQANDRGERVFVAPLKENRHLARRQMTPLDCFMMIRRICQLLVGLFLYGVAIAMMVQAGIGVSPWDVLTQGIARQTGLPFGLSRTLSDCSYWCSGYRSARGRGSARCSTCC